MEKNGSDERIAVFDEETPDANRKGKKKHNSDSNMNFIALACFTTLGHSF